ncbi:MAG TPA: hypothetical protein VLB08_03540 [Candidatus Deferrimicrobium sp.]|nr:hypothetical protein [Candidatus Deferrimicrobium sp.]
MRRIISGFAVLLLAGLSACGGGGGSASPNTGLTTPAVITTSNADNIARQAFYGGDLAANATLAPAREGDSVVAAEKPVAVTLVRLLSDAADALLPTSVPTRAPAPRAVVPIDETEPDGQGGSVRYILSVNDQTGAFTGTIVFNNYHGDGGGVIDGSCAVSGTITQYSMQIHFNFQSVRMVDGTEDVTAIGTVDMFSGTSGGNSTLNIVFRDNTTAKTTWFSDYTVAVTDLGNATDVRTFGRIYLHDYGYVDVHTEAPFIYPALSTQPTSGTITLTGDANCRARLTLLDATTYMLEVDADGNNSYEWSVTHTW